MIHYGRSQSDNLSGNFELVLLPAYNLDLCQQATRSIVDNFTIRTESYTAYQQDKQ